MNKSITKIKEFYKNEISGWKKWELIWLFIATITILGLSIYWKDALIGIISATTGVICVICTGKGKLSAYIFGIINTLLYSFIAFQAKYYGEVMLNLFYYFPLQFYGIYIWSKNMNSETHEVIKARMNNKNRLFIFFGVLLATLIYAFILNNLGGNLPFIDSLSTIISVAAMVISIKMYMEQWLLWIVVNIITVIMWVFAFFNGTDSIATLLMWIIYLGNAIIMYYKWKKEADVNYKISLNKKEEKTCIK